MGVFDGIARQFDDTPGGGIIESGPIEGSSNLLETQYRAATGAVDYSTAVWNDPRYSPNSTASEENMRESFELTGVSRDVFDTVSDYGGTWGGSEDSVDVLGPALFGAEGSVVDVLVQRQGEERSARESSTKLLLYGVVALVVLYVLAPLFEFGAALVGE